MEIRTYISLVATWRMIIILGIISLVYACSCPDEKISHLSAIAPSRHTLLAVTPSLSLQLTGDTLNKSYPQLRTGKVFPITGLLRVDGILYRFIFTYISFSLSFGGYCRVDGKIFFLVSGKRMGTEDI